MNFFGNGPEDEEYEEESKDQFEQLEDMINEEIENNYGSDPDDGSTE